MILANTSNNGRNPIFGLLPKIFITKKTIIKYHNLQIILKGAQNQIHLILFHGSFLILGIRRQKLKSKD